MHQQAVGQFLQPFHSFSIADHDRLFAEIGARHHQGASSGFGEQKVMQRRVRQKQAEIAIARRHFGGDSARPLPRQQHDGPLNRSEQLPRYRIDLAEILGSRQIRNHDRERLFHSVLAFAQSAHCFRIGRIGRQMKATQAFDGGHSSGSDQLGSCEERIAAFDANSVVVQQLQLRTAATSMRWAARESGGSGDRHILVDTPRTSGTPPSRYMAGRRECRGRW